MSEIIEKLITHIESYTAEGFTISQPQDNSKNSFDVLIMPSTGHIKWFQKIATITLESGKIVVTCMPGVDTFYFGRLTVLLNLF